MAGFFPTRDHAASDYTGKVETYAVDAAHATLLAPGDAVVITGTSNAEGIAEVDAAAAGAAITGVIAAVEPNFSGEALSETGLPAGTAGLVNVHISPDLVLEATPSATLVAADVGQNADIVATPASKSGGLTISNMTIDQTTLATTATLQFRIVGLIEDENGVLGNKCLVRFNNTTLDSGTAGV